MDVCKTARDLPKHIQKALANDIKKVINYISINFDVYKRGTQQLTGENQLLEQVLNALMIEEPLCAAITKTGIKCIRKAQGESRYCRQHALKAFTNNTPLNISSSLPMSNLTIVESHVDSHVKNVESLEKKFIEDSFYWIDEQYIYDLNNYNKVGYIDKSMIAESPTYVLTDDPFLLH